MRAAVFRALAGAVLWLSFAGLTEAHQVGISRGEYRAEGRSLQADLVFARPELAAAMPGLDGNDDGQLSGSEIAAVHARLATMATQGLTVSSDRGACRGELQQATLTANDGVALQLHYVCGDAPARFRLSLKLLSDLSVGHRHLATLMSSPGAAGVTQVMFEASPNFELAAIPAAGDQEHVAGPLFMLGLEHILSGFDHILFLFGVVLIGGKLRHLLIAVTAFTVAHSVTLGLATLGVWAPSPSLIEPAIALSIVYVGIENWFVGNAAQRWRLTFPFGLIHGFGFAGALQEIALPSAQVPMALVSFNLGVETGQILLLAVALPILYWLRQRPWFAIRGVRSTSGLIALAGMVWFVERIA